MADKQITPQVLNYYIGCAEGYADERVGVTSAYWAHTVWISELGR